MLTLGILLPALAQAVLAAAPPPPPEQRHGERPIQLAYRPPVQPGFGASALDRLFDISGPHPVLHAIAAPDVQPKHGAAAKDSEFPSRPSPRRTTEAATLVPVPAETVAYQRTFRALQESTEQTDRYDALILKYAQRYRLNPRLLKAIVAAESEFVHWARSPKGALGLMQLTAGTAREMGVAPERLTEPEENIKAGAAYLRHLFARAWRRYQLGSRHSFAQAPLWLTQRVIAAYNAGPRFLSRDHLYSETREYIRKVLLFLRAPVTRLRRHQPALSEPRFPARDRL